MTIVRQTDVFIVGAGPIGLELAVSLKDAGVDYVQVDAGQIGRTITWYPNQARFFSGPERIAIAGVSLVTPDQGKATKEQYLAYLRGVVRQYDLPVRTFERVEHIQRTADGFDIRTCRRDGEHRYRAKRVVLAVGDMHEPRMLDIPGEELDHVSHYFDDPHRYFRQRLLIVGGKNSAAEAALRCHHAGAKVSLSYRGAAFGASIKYWILPELNGLIQRQRITFYPHTQPVRITADQVTLASTDDDGQVIADAEPTTVDTDFALLLTGYRMRPTLFEMAGVELQGPNRSPQVDSNTMMTNVDGLYVAGTAAAGTQLHFRLFIENCHVHVHRIVTALTGSPPRAHLINQAVGKFDLPES